MWASGNGGDEDDCAADGYVSSIYTISVGAIAVDGRPRSKDERCSGKMVVAYVTNPQNDPAIVGCYTFSILIFNQFLNPLQRTTSPGGKCRDDFYGTSAAAPQVSGAIALALEAKYAIII